MGSKKNMKIANRDTRQFFLEFCYKWGIIWTEDVKTGRVFVAVVLLGKRYYSIVYAHLDDPVASENVMTWKTNCAGITWMWVCSGSNQELYWGVEWCLYNRLYLTLLSLWIHPHPNQRYFIARVPNSNFLTHIPYSILYLLYTLSLLDIALCCPC